MTKNCSACKWREVRAAAWRADRGGCGSCDGADEACRKCLEDFRKDVESRTRTCMTCEWKDRNLPYEARALRCRACAEAFARTSGHDCSKCPWNDPSRRQPTDATLAHCKACIEASGARKKNGAMNCASCQFRELPESSRRAMCIRCSFVFSGNSKVLWSTNELSNKGQTIISYDNHNAEMRDDRDTVTKIDRRYSESRKSGSAAGSEHPVHAIAFNRDEGSAEFAEKAYDKMKAFLYELGQLTDMQALLFIAEVNGVEKTDFAKNHNITDTAVSVLFKQILVKSPVFRDFIILTRGSIKGTRGRKPKDGTYLKHVPKTSKKKVYAGVFQPVLL